jgi:hypothetical protein
MSNARYGLRTLTLGEVRTLSRRNVLPFEESGFFSELFGVPDAAYSLRKLTPNSVYSGPAIRVRRSSDNAEQNINFIDNAADADIDTTDLLNFIGAGNSGFITTWYDQSGNSRNGTETTAADQPRIVNAGIIETTNSKNSMLFNNNTMFILSTGLTPNTVITVAKVDTESSVNALTRTSTTFDGFIQAGTFVTGIGLGSGGVLAQTTIKNLNQNLIFYNYNGTNYEIGINGASYLNVTNTDILEVGRIGRSGGFSLRGPYQELIMYVTSVTGNKNAIETNINNYYGIF